MSAPLDPLPIDLPPEPQAFDDRYYGEFYAALKKGTWRHKKEEADRVIGRDYAMLHWCAMRAMEWLPDMLDSASKIKVTTFKGENTCMLALKNKDITWPVFEKLIGLGVMPWLTHQSKRRYRQSDLPNPLVSLLPVFHAPLEDGKKSLQRQKILDYITLHFPSENRKEEVIGDALGYLLKSFATYKDTSETTDRFKQLRQHCVENWTSVLLPLKENKELSYGAYSFSRLIENVVFGMPAWVVEQLEKPTSPLAPFHQDILMACGNLLDFKSYSNANLYERFEVQETTFEVLKKVCSLDKNWNQEDHAAYFQAKEQVLSKIQEHSENEELFIEWSREQLSEKLEDPTLSKAKPKVRL